MNSTVAIVVSFHPEKALLENVKCLLAQVDHVVVVDNACSEASQLLLGALPTDRTTCIFNTENLGVGEGFNQGLRFGLKQSFDFFLLMDQDSQVCPGMVENLISVVTAYSDRRQLVLVGTRHEDFERKLVVDTSEAVQNTPLLITSGSLLSRTLIEAVGMYDERLFIDHVDHDYSLRVLKQGGRCLKVNSAVLLHRFGEARVKTAFGKSFFLQEYSAFRRYYMMRNRIVLYKRYGMFRGTWFWMDLRSAVKDLVKLVFFESNRIEKLRAVLRGLSDGLRWQD